MKYNIKDYITQNFVIHFSKRSFSSDTSIAIIILKYIFTEYVKNKNTKKCFS